MGTETLLIIGNNRKAVIRMVKLNDPLMGTETRHKLQYYNSCSQNLVKLNDPLMGTETKIELVYKFWTMQGMKLN